MLVSKNHLLVVCLILSVFLSGCVSIPPAPGASEKLSALCRSTGVSFSYDSVTRSVRLEKNGHRIYLVVGSDVVTIDQDRVLLDAPVVNKGDEIFVPPDFRQKVLYRLDKSLGIGRLKRGDLRIVIDPGHGGKDPGAVGNRLNEKDVVLDISKRLERLLKNNGHDVKMTRTSDVFLSLEERTERATEWNADLFISIHANSHESYRAHGFEVWAPRNLTREDLAEGQRKKNAQILFKQLNMQKRHRQLENALEDMVYEYKRDRSPALAALISQSCTKSVSITNRGVKESGFFVLRNTLIPSVLVEVGFISNSREAARLRDASFRQEIAEMLAEGIKEYYRGL